MRGCVVELTNENDKKQCLENDPTCKTCFEVGCNKKMQYLQCLVTDEDQSKAWNNFESLSSPGACKKYDDECFIQVIGKDTVIRGCVGDYAAQNDLPLNFLSSVENKRIYQICSGHLCNDELVNPMYCLACNSINDQKCADDPMAHMYFRKRCHPLEVHHSGCYHFTNGSYVERGCISDLNDEWRVECESDSENCKKCVGLECNYKNEFLKCLSGFDDSNSKHESKLCRRYNDECFIHAGAVDGKVRRGCLSDLIDSPVSGIDIISDCRNLKICERCTWPNCNKRELEKEHCIVCSSEDEDNNYCKYGPTLEMRQQCPASLKLHGCYLSYGDVTTRGCVSQLDAEQRNECNDLNSQCKICHGDVCNKKRYFDECSDCSTEIDGDKCTVDPWNVTQRRCPNYMDQCYTHIENGFVRRNCTGDDFIPIADVCANSKHCVLCSGWRCNGLEIKRDQCISCDSNENPNCKNVETLDDNADVQKCPISVKPEGCYHFVDEQNGHHLRGNR